MLSDSKNGSGRTGNYGRENVNGAKSVNVSASK
jgi:hypothetical protein